MTSSTSETSTLLGYDGLTTEERAIEDAGYGTNVEAASKTEPELQTTWKIEIKLLFGYSVPLILTYILQYSYQLINVFVAGQLGTKELGAASLASMISNITGLFIYEGLATSLDTLASQAFGAGKPKLVGLHLQRMVALMLLATIPIGAVWISSPWILSAIIPEKDIAQLAGAWLRVYLLGAPGYGMWEAGKRFLQAQGDFTTALYVLLVCAPLNVFFNWIFVFKFHLGFEGAALATAITLNLEPLLLFLYIYFLAPSTLQCWPGFTRQALQNWGPMLRLALPGMLMVSSFSTLVGSVGILHYPSVIVLDDNKDMMIRFFAEWLAFEILTFSAAYLSAATLAAQSVLMTVCVMMWHIPFPISVAASTRFGNLIGHGALTAAKIAVRTDYVVFTILGVIDIILLTSLRHVIPLIFTHDLEVRAIIASVMPVVSCLQFFDAMTAMCNGLLRGMGAQRFGGFLNLGVYYVLAVPLSMFLTFGPPKMDLMGLWIGPTLGLACCSIGMTLYLRMTDWRKAVEAARSREE